MRKIKSKDQSAKIPIVILTAKNLTESEKQEIKQLGSSVWVKLSLDRQALVAHVDQIVKNQPT